MAQPFIPHGETTCPSPIFSEPLCALEYLNLRLSPAYSGAAVPKGDGSAVVIIPGLLGFDLVMAELFDWLRRIGYRPYFSGMGVMADCPNRLSQRLDATIDRAYKKTGGRVHLIGHSIGGIFARSAAVRRPSRVASVISLGTPFRGLVINGLVLAVGHAVRALIRTTGPDYPLECASSRCSCSFARSLSLRWPRSVRQTAVFSKCDGVVDWRYCLTGRPEVDVEVIGTHLGMPFNARVFGHIAERLSGVQ